MAADFDRDFGAAIAGRHAPRPCSARAILSSFDFNLGHAGQILHGAIGIETADDQVHGAAGGIELDAASERLRCATAMPTTIGSSGRLRRRRRQSLPAAPPGTAPGYPRRSRLFRFHESAAHRSLPIFEPRCRVSRSGADALASAQGLFTSTATGGDSAVKSASPIGVVPATITFSSLPGGTGRPWRPVRSQPGFAHRRAPLARAPSSRPAGSSRPASPAACGPARCWQPRAPSVSSSRQ